MSDPQVVPIWIIPLFLVFFAAVWALVISLLALVGGWTSLARLYREPAGIARTPVQSFRAASLSLRRGAAPLPVNYNNCVIAEIAPAGLHLRPWRAFRLLHPPLLIPWSEIERFEPGRYLFWSTMTIHPRGVRIHIRLFGAAGEAVAEVARQWAAQAPQPAPV
jgi:hypothetical protein